MSKVKPMLNCARTASGDAVAAADDAPAAEGAEGKGEVDLGAVRLSAWWNEARASSYRPSRLRHAPRLRYAAANGVVESSIARSKLCLAKIYCQSRGARSAGGAACDESRSLTSVHFTCSCRSTPRQPSLNRKTRERKHNLDRVPLSTRYLSLS